MSRSYAFITSAVLLIGAATAFAQAPAAGAGRQGAGAPAGARAGGPARRPALLFKEEWKQNEKSDEHPASQDSIGNANLELKMYYGEAPAGATKPEVLLTGKAGDENNPIHVWTGMCTTPCAVTLRDKTNMADLTGLARIKWNTKMSGFHEVRPIVKLADGTWLIGNHTSGTTTDWIVDEFNLSDVKWLKLDIKRIVTTGTYVNNVDLSKVDEIGFADLMPGSGHGPGGWADVAQIEVYGKAVPRSGATQ
jgi:hypothetical protein